MTKSRILLVLSILALATGAVAFYGCGSSSTASTKFTIVGAGQ